jgi:outer membrane lipoprotein-sorting protein
MNTMMRSKVKLAAGVAAATLLAPPVTGAQSGGEEATTQEIIAKSRSAYAALSSYSDNGTVVSAMGNQNQKLAFNSRKPWKDKRNQ